jgi:hypothetical protein
VAEATVITGRSKLTSFIAADAPQEFRVGSSSKAKPKRKRNDRAEARRRGRQRLLKERRRLFLSVKDLPDDACLTLVEWGALNSLSERQARRILASADGPVITQLSAKRRGVTVRANREWQARRALTR